MFSKRKLSETSHYKPLGDLISSTLHHTKNRSFTSYSDLQKMYEIMIFVSLSPLIFSYIFKYL
jgi:hypothetical protein